MNARDGHGASSRTGVQKLSKWQRLKPYEKFAETLIDRSIGTASPPTAGWRTRSRSASVEGLNNKIRVIQRRAYGLRNEEYLRLKILTCMLPAL